MNTNSKLASKRFTMTVIGYSGVLVCAVLKHWLSGISEALVITAAGLVTAYITGESMRPSGDGGTNG